VVIIGCTDWIEVSVEKEPVEENWIRGILIRAKNEPASLAVNPFSGVAGSLSVDRLSRRRTDDCNGLRPRSPDDPIRFTSWKDFLVRKQLVTRNFRKQVLPLASILMDPTAALLGFAPVRQVAFGLGATIAGRTAREGAAVSAGFIDFGLDSVLARGRWSTLVDILPSVLSQKRPERHYRYENAGEYLWAKLAVRDPNRNLWLIIPPSYRLDEFSNLLNAAVALSVQVKIYVLYSQVEAESNGVPAARPDSFWGLKSRSSRDTLRQAIENYVNVSALRGVPVFPCPIGNDADNLVEGFLRLTAALL
jgi:hypothetical protein